MLCALKTFLRMTAHDGKQNERAFEGMIPELNGYAPTSVSLTDDKGEFEYDEETRKFTIQITL